MVQGKGWPPHPFLPRLHPSAIQCTWAVLQTFSKFMAFSLEISCKIYYFQKAKYLSFRTSTKAILPVVALHTPFPGVVACILHLQEGFRKYLIAKLLLETQAFALLLCILYNTSNIYSYKRRHTVGCVCKSRLQSYNWFHVGWFLYDVETCWSHWCCMQVLELVHNMSNAGSGPILLC